ncbi:T9SS type A sorting domain-containing protein [Flavobacterium sp. GSP27]|uniref:alpha-amylase family glycosyl hydrolase n=1 Tax=Flavobacterium sp. GSP27 TaxID=2497489 RepID=UPI000F8298E1|nr:alpha-amylase family glycosyl hydrolase [Flavobacterium sp. GSP27]RTY96101.1 T9SS type A sorting domain-containing protein [Flavobacterium sp. GSN2]RTZ11406.1 T9SS type A sorting domain-containing protein [Flavobacterium sp. GSP27]
MKKNLLLLILLITSISYSQFTTTPSPAIASSAVTLNFNKTGTPLASYTGTIYAHIGLTVNGTRWQNEKGSWGNNSTQPALTLVSGTTYKLDLTPDLYAYFGIPNTSSITEICVVLRNDAGNMQTADTFFNVGAFQATLTSPAENSSAIIASGGSLNISASNTGGNASYVLKANGTTLNINTAASSYTFNHTNITGNQIYELEVTQGTTVITKKFSVIVNTGTISAAMANGLLDGINYNTGDATKATLVLDAPLKDFIYVAGSFNNWQPTSAHSMKKDPTSGKFWLELTGLVSGTNYMYQYWVGDATPLAGSPGLVKTADPYSTLVLSPFDDPGISSVNYPNLPVYPVGQEREVTVLQTGKAAYAWSSATTNFVKPAKEKLVVYELLVRDFDANKSYQDLINKIDYFKNLKINAIELMPVMEFEGNESWGYNTSFHMALDKFYGTSDKLKEFIDLCHQNGIAVILDVALNHAFGRNPMLRMWMNDPDGNGWGSPSTENPYFNTTAMHSYSVGEDFNHQLPRTQNYVQRVIKQWVEEYKIDGFRWDLTKGFTQNCPANVAGGQENCTGSLQQDRIDVLKKYADYSWNLDPNHYVIFEHLGGNEEEQQWANYRLNETLSKGVMMWGIMTFDYNNLTKGYAGNISRMSSSSRGFTAHRLMGYAESHDEERLMYNNVQAGNNTTADHNVRTLTVALSRMSALGAVSLLVPGPKMIWQFGELGWNSSIFTCNNGTVNSPSDGTSGDCKLDTKPQPQWTGNWLGDTSRSIIYDDWAKMITMKTEEPVFLGTVTINNSSSLLPNIKITNSALASTQLKDVLIVANFDVTPKNAPSGFPYTGTWYNLMDNTSINVISTSVAITLKPGEFKIYGNKTASLAIADYEKSPTIVLYPNPASDYFTLNETTAKVQVFSITGQLLKSFDTNKTAGSQFSVSDLNQGLYIVKTFDENNEMKVLKLLKN